MNRVRQLLKEAESRWHFAHYNSGNSTGFNAFTPVPIKGRGNCQCDMEQKAVFQGA